MTIAKLCVKYGVPLVVSSDAHFAGSVGEVGDALELLEANGIPEEAILNANAKRFAAKLTEITGRTFDV
jgi:putative hydrolase